MRSPSEEGAVGFEAFGFCEATGASSVSFFGGVGGEGAFGAGAASDVEGV